MRIRDILQEIHHRPWEMPKHSWKYYQEWNDAVFLHWKVEELDLRKYVPKELEIDLVNDSAWISVVGFNMENIRPRQLPAFAPISNFYEINIRTYVKFNQKTGVYFLSIEGGKELSCRIAKRMSQLPYRYSKMKRKPGIYTSENQFPKSKLVLEYQIGNLQTSKSETDLFLTERYALFQEAGNRLNEFEIHHIEWPVYELEIKNLKINYSQFPDFFQNPADIVHYSPGVKVIAWDKKSFTMNGNPSYSQTLQL